MSSSAFDTPDLSGLIELSRDPQLDLKPVVLRVQTDLFLAAPIRDRAVLEAFSLLATGLIPTVDEDTALIVARKLAPCRDTPEAVLASLAKRGPAVRAALLDAAAVDSASAAPAAPMASAADGPPQAAEVKSDAAAGTGFGTESAEAHDDASSDEGFSDEPWIEERPHGRSLPELIKSARTDQDRAASLLARQDLGDADLAPLWLHADRQQRAAIRDAVEATAALRPCPPAPRELGAALTELSTQRDVTGLVATLAGGLGLPDGFLAAAPDASARYDLLTLALRAADLRDSEAIHVFLTLNETVARSVSRVFDLAALYRSTSRAAARDLLCAILDTSLPERTGAGAHRPYLAPDAARPRLSPAAERALPRVVPIGRTRQTG